MKLKEKEKKAKWLKKERTLRYELLYTQISSLVDMTMILSVFYFPSDY